MTKIFNNLIMIRVMTQKKIVISFVGLILFILCTLLQARQPPWKVELIDQDEIKFSIEHSQGKIRLINFIFTNCLQACPTQTSGLVTVQKNLDDNISDHVEFLSISIDPDRDTPARMKKFALDRNVDFKNWKFATGKAENLSTIADYLNANVIGDKEVMDHRLMVFMLGPKDELLQIYPGSEFDTKRLVEDINHAIHIIGTVQ